MAITAATESISAKLRKDEKDRFSAICDEIGTSPSNAIRMFVSAFNRRGGFPFDPSNPYGFSAETLAAMDDAITGRNLPGPHSTVICHNQTCCLSFPYPLGWKNRAGRPRGFCDSPTRRPIA